jgi:hypothetical protein
MFQRVDVRREFSSPWTSRALWKWRLNHTNLLRDKHSFINNLVFSAESIAFVIVLRHQDKTVVVACETSGRATELTKRNNKTHFSGKFFKKARSARFFCEF